MSTVCRMTLHAWNRSRTRKIPTTAMDAALLFGSVRARRGATHYILGWREVDRMLDEGIDLTRFEGTCVVCSNDEQVITVYRRLRGPSRRVRSARMAA
jgi:hypothetical protein